MREGFILFPASIRLSVHLASSRIWLFVTTAAMQLHMCSRLSNGRKLHPQCVLMSRFDASMCGQRLV